MGSGINNQIYEFLCNSKNVKKRRNTRDEICYGHVHIATAFSQMYLAATMLNWFERRASNVKVSGSIPALGITSLCYWKRHLTLFF